MNTSHLLIYFAVLALLNVIKLYGHKKLASHHWPFNKLKGIMEDISNSQVTSSAQTPPHYLVTTSHMKGQCFSCSFSLNPTLFLLFWNIPAFFIAFLHVSLLPCPSPSIASVVPVNIVWFAEIKSSLTQYKQLEGRVALQSYKMINRSTAESASTITALKFSKLH